MSHGRAIAKESPRTRRRRTRVVIGDLPSVRTVSAKTAPNSIAFTLERNATAITTAVVAYHVALYSRRITRTMQYVAIADVVVTKASLLTLIPRNVNSGRSAMRPAARSPVEGRPV